jgi:hypothetical protein
MMLQEKRENDRRINDQISVSSDTSELSGVNAQIGVEGSEENQTGRRGYQSEGDKIGMENSMMNAVPNFSVKSGFKAVREKMLMLSPEKSLEEEESKLIAIDLPMKNTFMSHQNKQSLVREMAWKTPVLNKDEVSVLTAYNNNNADNTINLSIQNGYLEKLDERMITPFKKSNNRSFLDDTKDFSLLNSLTKENGEAHLDPLRIKIKKLNHEKIKYNPDVQRSIIKSLLAHQTGKKYSTQFNCNFILKFQSKNHYLILARIGTPGEKRFLVSANWWRRWKEHVNFDRITHSERQVVAFHSNLYKFQV